MCSFFIPCPFLGRFGCIRISIQETEGWISMTMYAVLQIISSVHPWVRKRKSAARYQEWIDAISNNRNCCRKKRGWMGNIWAIQLGQRRRGWRWRKGSGTETRPPSPSPRIMHMYIDYQIRSACESSVLSTSIVWFGIGLFFPKEATVFGNNLCQREWVSNPTQSMPCSASREFAKSNRHGEPPCT